MTKKELEWDSDQKAVITAPADLNLLVESPPGCGKTEVACARVSFLIEQSVEPSNIFLFSFTRTAVAEIRKRILQLSRDIDKAKAVRISTLDSAVWQLCHGFTEADFQQLLKDYDDNIRAVLAMLDEKNELLMDYLGQLEHVIVDEAQDLTGIRGQLVYKIIKNLHPNCGVTVFADRAQAIYEFTTDGVEDLDDGEEPFLDHFQTDPEISYVEYPLNHVYRTENETLLQIITDTRDLLDNPVLSPRDKLRAVVSDIESIVSSCDADLATSVARNGNETLVLYRRRLEVLLASSYLSSDGVEHRIRMSGLPVVIRAWVGRVLGPVMDSRLSRVDFERRWLVSGADYVGDIDCDIAWELLYKTAGDQRGRVDMRELIRILSRSRPPFEFCRPECGTCGPIISTIHASKGREAPRVILKMPSNWHSRGTTTVEESRVIYVGATRARDELEVGSGFSTSAASLEDSGRVFRIIRSDNRAQVEFGRDGDLDVTGSVSTRLYEDRRNVEEIQDVLSILGSKTCKLVGYPDPNLDYRCRLLLDEGNHIGKPVGMLSAQMNKDLWSITNEIMSRTRYYNLKPPTEIHHLYLFGVRTVVLGNDDPRRDELHHPWSESGFFLAPVVKGFSTLIFPRRARR